MNEDVIEGQKGSLSAVQDELPRPPSTNRRPPTRGKDQTLTNGQRSTQSSVEKSQRTAVERQSLLPRSLSDIEVDPDAIPVAVPGAFPRTNAMPQVVGSEKLSNTPTFTNPRHIRSRGPQPKNTLNLGSQKAPWVPTQSYTNTPTSARSTFGRTGVGRLSTKPVVGDNVLRTSTQRSPSVSFDQRPIKRAKLHDNTGPKEVVTVEDDSAEDELHSDTNTIRVERPRASKTRTSSVVSHRTGPFLSSYQGRQNPPGYSSLNDIMDSSRLPQYKKEQERKNSLSRGPSSVTTAKLDIPALDPTAADGPREISKALYKGTARPNAQPRRGDNNRNGIVKRMQTEETSRHFVDPSRTNGNSAGHHSTRENSVVAQLRTEPHSPNLHEQFKSTDGKRRGSGSSDPLADGPGPAKYAEVVRVSPQGRLPNEPLLRSGSLTAIDSRLSEGHTGLPKSNIRPSTFISSRPKKPDLLSVPKKRKDTRRTERVGFACSSIFTDKQYLQGDDIGLVFDDGGTDLEIHQGGENLTQQSPSFRVRTQKVLKIVWSNSSRKVRLELSQTAHEDRIVDLELFTEKYRLDLIQSLMARVHCDVTEKSSDTMDKMFANRLKEEGSHDRQKAKSYEQQDTDIQFLARKTERRNEDNQASMDASNTKRRRINDRVADKLQPNHQNQVVQTQYGHGQEKDQGIGSKDTSTENDSSRIKETLARFKVHTGPKTHRTRASLSSSNVHPKPRELSPELSDFPEESRFSVKHGLGTPWREPLVYPKEGKKKTTVDQKDLERLDEGQFLNDNLIGFYLRYLECKLMRGRPEMAEKVYWFNTYFFASLTKTARGKKGINYEAVRKWTRGVDIFNYEYAVVPINESAHWYVAIICNLPALQRIPDDSRGDDPSSSAFHEFGSNGEAGDEPVEGSVTETKPEEQDESQILANLDLNDKSSILDVEELEVLDPTIDDGHEDPAAQLQAELLNEGEGVLRDTRHGPVEQVVPDPSIAVSLLTGKGPASQKKSKRKSIPPIKRIDPDQPAIMTLDSLGLSHPPTIRILKDYLLAEANDKRGGLQLDDGQIKGTTAKGIPQQDNFCDCGLFLLGYMDKFVENPRVFVHKILQREYDEERDWPNLHSSKMRENMRNLIQTLHAEQHAQGPRQSIKRIVPQGVTSISKTPLVLNKDDSGKASSKSRIGETSLPADQDAHTRPRIPPVKKLEASFTTSMADDPTPPSALQEVVATTSEADISTSPRAKQEAAARTFKIDNEKLPVTKYKASATALDVDKVQPPTSRQEALASALSVDDLERDPCVNAETARDLATGHVQGVPVTAENAKESTIVILDSQPEANEYALLGTESEADPKPSERKLEPELVIPTLPPRPMVIVPSPTKKRKNMREIAESPERRTRTTIPIDDN